MGKQLHVLAVPYPAQGHVKPLMQFSHLLTTYGVKVTVLIAEFAHKQLIASLPEKSQEHSLVRIISVPDGLEPEDDLKDIIKVTEAVSTIVRGNIKDLIKKFNESNDEEEITCVIADTSAGWILEDVAKMGIKRAAFWPASVASLALGLFLPKLIEDGIINENGVPTKKEMIGASPDMPALSSEDLKWTEDDQPVDRKIMFEFAKTIFQGVNASNWTLCNSSYELEPTNCDLIPGILTIGPLLEPNACGKLVGQLLQEDSSCLTWLDEQPTRSVIYVAFGSTTVFNLQQFEELAHGLELVDQPFLWVVRPGLVDGVDIDGLTGIIPQNGKVVSWAPQQKVLAHPSVACFVSHCGWNSTIEGLTSGIPFLCRPYFGDQFKNQGSICDDWKIGLRLNRDKNGTISRDEIKGKVEQLLGDEKIKANALAIKEMVGKSISEGGSSRKNLEDFLEQIKK